MSKKITLICLMLCLAAGKSAAQEVSSSANYKLESQSAAPAVALPPVVAKVDGIAIPIQQFWKRILSQAGNSVLTALVDEILIEEEAKRRLDKSYSSGTKGEKFKQKKKMSSALKKIESEVEKKYEDLKKQFPDEKTFLGQLSNAGMQEEEVKKQIRLDLYKRELLGEKLNVKESEIKKYFDENRERLAVPEQIRLKHILAATEQDAKEILFALKVGAKFDLLAKEKSLDKASKDQGGDLGFFSETMLSPEIRDKSFALKAGETDVIKTDQGYHVVQVAERKPAKPAVWNAEMKKNIEAAMKQVKFDQNYPELIQSLRSKAKIEVLLNQ